MIICVASKIIIAGYVTVTIMGHNLGASIADVVRISFRDHTCDSIIVYSSKEVHCVLTTFTPAIAVTLVPADIVYATIGGSITGIYSQPEVIVASGSGRPVVTHVIFKCNDFLPYALALSPGNYTCNWCYYGYVIRMTTVGFQCLSANAFIPRDVNQDLCTGLTSASMATASIDLI